MARPEIVPADPLPVAPAEVYPVGMEEHSADLADTIVVGHDGSKDGDAAFEVALGLAARLGCPMRLVRAWSVETAPHGTLMAGGYVSSLAEASASIALVLERDAASRRAEHPDVHIDFLARFGQAGAVLIAASSGALMLVVGGRGRGGIASMLLGSVSEQCVRHAHCPVLVVRTDKHGRSERKERGTR